jgi:hypothetical protein
VVYLVEDIVIGRNEMIEPMLQACPSFRPAWIEFLNEWQSEEDKPLYVALGRLADHLIAMLAARDTAGLLRAFAVIEHWHIEGDSYVREAATIGVLENLLNESLHESTSPKEFERFLLPESLKYWSELNRFWNNGDQA